MTDQNAQLFTYHQCLVMLTCSPPQQNCFSFFSQECVELPGSDKLQNLLENLLEENGIEHIIFKQCICTHRSTLETNVKPNDLFIDVNFKAGSITATLCCWSSLSNAFE
jgi:hypothetical protein